MGLTIELLGTPLVRVDDRDLVVDTRKAVAVLALVATDGAQGRDRLAALLWPDSEPSRARGALRRTLSVLNSALGASALVTDGGRLELPRTADIDVDVRRLRDGIAEVRTHDHGPAGSCEACIAPLTAAVTGHRGPFLDGFTLRDVTEFDEWRTVTAEQLRRELVAVMDRLTRALVDAGELDTASGYVESWLALDPLNEHVHARLMLLDAWRGLRASAVQRYRTCVAVLHRELGVAPLDRTTQLYRQVVAGTIEPPPVAGRHHPVEVVEAPVMQAAADPGLIGRDDEVAELVGQLSGTPATPEVVEGEAGIGKTRVLAEVATRLTDAGVVVLTMRCHRREHALAYAPLVDLLRSASEQTPDILDVLGEAQRRELARLLPDLVGVSPGPAAADPEVARGRFVDALAAAVDAACGGPGRRRALLVDDADAADTATLDVIGYLARRQRDDGLALVLAWRPEETAARHPVRLLAASLDARTVTLDRLDRDATRAMAAEAGAPEELADRVHDESEGLPLAIVEYLQLLAEGTPPSSAEPWPVPSGLRNVVASRLGLLSDTAGQLATAAAVLGRTFDLELLGRVAGRTEDETVSGVEELLARGVLRDEAGGYDFAHDKIRAVVLDQASAVRRRLLHARAAASLRDQPADGVRRAARVAEHERLAGHDREAADWELAAGDDAWRVFASDAAAAHWERALSLEHPDPAGVHRRLARLAVYAGDYDEALPRLELAAALAGDDAELATIEHDLGTLQLRRGRWETARTHLAAARVLAVDPGTAARIVGDLALLELRVGDLDAADPLATEALHLAEEAEDREALAQCRNVVGMLARRRGDVREAQRQLEHAAALAARLPDPSAYVAALNNLALSTAAAGDHERAVMHLALAVESCTEVGDRHRLAALHNNLADLHHQAGDDEAAMLHLKQAAALFAEVGETAHPEIWKLVEW